MIVETHNDLTGLSAEDLGRIHVIGIGGVGMNGVARLLVTRGLAVSGSDIKEWPALDGLRALGATVYLGHSIDHLDGVDTVVYSTAIRSDHLELAEARRRGLRVLHRAEALVTAMNGRKVVAVAGTNGKTTTTSMITAILQHCGADPSFVIGGEMVEIGSSAHHGTGEHFVVEADESDKTFLLYRPHLAIVTNIEADHLDTYGDLAGVEAGFAEFADRIDSAGYLVVCADDPGAMRLGDYARAQGRTVITYGRSETADLRLTDEVSDTHGTSFSAIYQGKKVGVVTLGVPGPHLALNAAGALLSGIMLGCAPRKVIDALAAYQGVRRRFELRGVEGGIRVYDDYAYHPTSMAAQLRTVREVAGEGRLLVVFQPYRLYRLLAFLDGIAEALALADEVVVMEVFCPGEERLPGQGGAALARAIPLPEGSVVFEPSWSGVAPEVANRARPGDLVLTMGAPPISMMADDILPALQERWRG
jgi:UDP-N-acetylmuramate--alanine ligase